MSIRLNLKHVLVSKVLQTEKLSNASKLPHLNLNFNLFKETYNVLGSSDESQGYEETNSVEY